MNDFLIIASGCSVTPDIIKYIEQHKHNLTTIAINNNYELAPWADVLYYCDRQFYNWHKKEIKTYEGIKATISTAHADWKFRAGEETGLSFNPNVLNTGKNSGYQALNLACLMGASRVLLVGYDMKYTNGRKHWFGDHPVKGEDIFQDMIDCFNTIQLDLERFGTSVINCNPDSALDCFRKAEIQEVLR
jgi:hypothetical protein